MRIGSLEVPGVLSLGPMAGVTDLAFRTICAEQGAAITVSEMVSSRALIYKDKKTAGLLKRNPGSVYGAQIFGSDPAVMAEGAKLALEISGADFIDINMGCPVGKVVANGDGSALMKDIPLAASIVEAVARAVPVPVTVKCRLGWDKGSINAPELARAVEQAGAQMIAVHGRTRSMLYSGAADWDSIARVKEAVSIPLIANGDICSYDAILQCRKRTGADGFMVGRPAFGDPWLFAELKAALEGRPAPQRPDLPHRIDTALRQIELSLADKGEHIACLEARKHFAWYLHGVPYSNFYKNQISSLASMEDVYRIAKEIKRDLR